MPNWHCTDLYGKDLHEEERLPQGISFFYLQQKTPGKSPKTCRVFPLLVSLIPTLFHKMYTFNLLYFTLFFLAIQYNIYSIYPFQKN